MIPFYKTCQTNFKTTNVTKLYQIRNLSPSDLAYWVALNIAEKIINHQKLTNKKLLKALVETSGECGECFLY